MKRTVVAVAMLIFVTACGVDGPPERPSSNGPGVSVTITGAAEIGVSGGNKSAPTPPAPEV